MSYHQQASKINQQLQKAFEGMDDEQVKLIINTMLWFGQVAKFRCKSNTAYDNFSNACLRDIVKIGRAKPDHLDFEILGVID